jgi:uncharacterized membrane protein
MALFKRLIPYILVILLSFFAILPLFHPGFFPIHDDTQAQRVFEMAKSLSMGMFPVRWVLDLGYGLGYPIFNFYAPLAYYFGAAVVFLGFDALIATKIMIGFGVLLASFSMYLLAKEFWGKLGGIISALLYVYFPYHAVNIFVRGAVSEFWAYAFIPLALFGFYKFFKENRYRYAILSIIGFSGIILSHNLTALMIIPFLTIELVIFAIVNYKKKNNKNTLYLACTFLLSLIISAFYWLPALTEMGNTNVLSTIGGSADFRNNFVCLNQLWYSPWGFGGSTATCNDGMSFMLGKMNILVFALSLIGLFLSWIHKKRIEKTKEYLLLILFLGLCISIFLTLPYSRFIWEAKLWMKYLQYPWRYLSMVGFFSAFLSGSVILFSKQLFKNKTVLIVESIIIAILITAVNVKYFQPQKYLSKTVKDYTSEYSLKWTTSKISDEYLPIGIKKPKNAEEALKNKPIFSFKQTATEKTADIISLAGIVILVLGIISSRKKVLHV